jgi:hypothetical protein
MAVGLMRAPLHLARRRSQRMAMRMERISMRMRRRMSRTSIVRIMLLQSRRLGVAREEMDLVGRGGLVADVVAAGVGRGRALVGRRVAAIARVSS